MMSTAIAAAAILILGAFITDVRSMRISNKWSGAFFVGAMLYHTAVSGLTGVKLCLIGTAAGFIPLLLLYAAKGIGAGDVKLFGALGAWLGMEAVWHLLLYSILYAGGIAVCLLVVRRAFRARIAIAAAVILSGTAENGEKNWRSWISSGTRFPFMLAVAPAAITSFFGM